MTAATTAASDVMTTSTLAGLKETGEELLQDTDSGGRFVWVADMLNEFTSCYDQLVYPACSERVR